MQKILLLGAGRSSGALITYLLTYASTDQYQLTIADLSLEAASSKAGNHLHAVALALNIHDEAQRRQAIADADIVISLLPPALHILAAVDCVHLKKHLVTASYLTPAIEALHEEAVKAGILILNECGLDPGIDHMSAMELFHRLKKENTILTGFKSYTGGLITPESEDNPWGYKFTWNPRNVILAGQGTAKYIENNSYHYIPYNRIFRQIEKIEIPGIGLYEGYANRDSLAYRKHYGIENIPTLLRGTLRRENFCKSWDAFVQLGLTDDNCIIENSETLTYRQVVESFLPAGLKGSVRERTALLMGWDVESMEMDMLQSTGIFDDRLCGLPNATAAMILQHLLESKWVLNPGDKDMIVMVHLIQYIKNGTPLTLISSLVVKGDDAQITAMAKTVGYPLGIVARLLLQGKISRTGVHLPVHQDIYIPVLRELEEMNIIFKEEIK